MKKKFKFYIEVNGTFESSGNKKADNQILRDIKFRIKDDLSAQNPVDGGYCQYDNEDKIVYPNYRIRNEIRPRWSGFVDVT